MDKKLVMLVGIVIALVGLVLLITAIMNYNALMDRVGWYLETFSSSTRYTQEITNYYAIGFIGFILLISGIAIAAFSGREKNKSNVTSKKRGERRCPSCGRVIPMDANLCPYCSKKF